MSESASHFFRNAVMTAGLVLVLFAVQTFQFLSGLDLGVYGILPRHPVGLRGIFFSPFIHGSWEHLASNTLPFIVLMTVLLNAYDFVALRVLVFIHLLSGIMVWSFTPVNGFHIGISGIIYGIAAFLISSGVFRRDRSSVIIALMVAMLYGSMVWGFVPQQGVSWQSHLWGAVSGILIAFLFRNKNLPDPEEREDTLHRHFFEVHPHREHDHNGMY